jgi:hypothetical protein
MSGPQDLTASFEERLAAECHSTSFKHALHWLMRNLLKIPRGALGVNVGRIYVGILARSKWFRGRFMTTGGFLARFSRPFGTGHAAIVTQDCVRG